MLRTRPLLSQIRIRRAASRRSGTSLLGNANFRDWLNVLATVATALIGLVGLWNTARISGLEDYFRSEIVRRNDDLVSLGKQTDRLSAEAVLRRNQLATLQISTSDLTNQSIAQQDRIQQAAEQLAATRIETLNANLKLNSTQQSIAALTAERDRQGRRLELIYRRQSVAILGKSGGPSFLEGWDFGQKPRPAETIEVGKSYQATLELVALPGEDQILAPYVYRARDRIEQVCPTIFSRTIEVAEIPPEIVSPTLHWSGVRTKADADAFNKEWEEYFKKYRLRRDAIIAASSKRVRDFFDFYSDVRTCSCKALAENGFTEAEVCKVDR